MTQELESELKYTSECESCPFLGKVQCIMFHKKFEKISGNSQDGGFYIGSDGEKLELRNMGVRYYQDRYFKDFSLH